MKLFDGISPQSLAIGAGVVLLTPVVIPIIGGVLRPLTKAVIKGALLAYQGAKVSIAETRESLDDIVSEAKSEVNQGADA